MGYLVTLIKFLFSSLLAVQPLYGGFPLPWSSCVGSCLVPLFPFWDLQYPATLAWLFRTSSAFYLTTALQAFVGPWPLFQFLDLFTKSVGLLERGISPSQGRYLHTWQHKQNKRTQTSMPQRGFEPTIPVFERVKTVHALDRAATVIGFFCLPVWKKYFFFCIEMSRLLWWGVLPTGASSVWQSSLFKEHYNVAYLPHVRTVTSKHAPAIM
jgi:hypothetical protein